MNTHIDGSLWKWMAAVVLVHLTISMAHGTAHNSAHILMSPAANLFVFVVILASPIVGLAISWRSERLGSLIVALAMASSLVFGFVNHFMLESPDHVRQVEAHWRMFFATTAALLAITEMLGLGVSIRLVRQRWS